MATKSIDTLFPLIQPDITSCPNGVVRTALLQAAIEFCSKSEAWNEMTDPIPLESGNSAYAIDIPADARLLQLKGIYGPSLPLRAVSLAELNQLLPNWQSVQGSQPIYYLMLNWDEFQVFPQPNDPASVFQMTVHASFTPKQSAKTLPDYLIERYGDAICSGAKARLMAMPKQPWSADPYVIGVYRSSFLAEADQARIEVDHARVQGSIRVTPRRFGG